ncbi:hypothetical protein [Oceanobacillus manasiensis]|uniref:hypothetical protein n=1 Tax=Oceanobacillus manasiensis TaxID=586413 RepID=UPI0005A8B335|nr:hypothetical protein [Oceanobacillus manasiensis]
MKKMLTIGLITVLTLMGACSSTEGKQAAQNNSLSNKEVVEKEEKITTKSTGDTKEIDKEVAGEREEASANKSTEDFHSDTNSTAEEMKTEEEVTISEPDFDIETYLNEHYAIENTHYNLDNWENQETGRTEYTVRIMPNNQEFGEEIEAVFENGNPYMDDERTKNMFKVAEELLVELPQLNDRVHIDSVVWSVTKDDEFPVLLIQDRAQSTIN